MKQTAVTQLLQYCEYRKEKSTNSSKSAWNMIIAYIKENTIPLEREQIIDAYTEGNRQEFYDATETTLSEKYYNKTYKS